METSIEQMRDSIIADPKRLQRHHDSKRYLEPDEYPELDEGIEELRKFKFELIRASELTLETRGFNWLVKDYIECANLVEVFGAPESCKSLVMLEMGFCIACGIDWYGHKVKKGDVIYIAGEGFEGIKRRLKALEEKYDTKAENLHVSRLAAQILDDENAEAVRDAISEACDTPVLVIVDTLNRNFGGGDENSTRDMTQFICNVDYYLKRGETSAIVVHHSGLTDKDRSRGSSALYGALDLQYKVKKDNHSVTLESTKAKDITTPAPLAFTLKGVPLDWCDEEGNTITSALLESAEYVPTTTSTRITHRDEMALKALREAVELHGIKPTSQIKQSFGCLEYRKVVHVDNWRDKFYPLIDVDGDQEAKKKAFQRTRTKLLQKGKIAMMNDYFWEIFDRQQTGRDGT